MEDKIYQFKIFNKYNNLVNGVFSKSFGNLSLKYDKQKKITANKKNIAKKISIDWKKICSVKQYHSSEVLVIKSAKQCQKEFRADAMITKKKNVFLMIKTADCFPVLFYDPEKQVIAAIHVGWRGAIEKIFFNALLKMTSSFDCHPADILVGIGPGIRDCCFKHKTLVQEKLPEWKKFIKTDKKGWKSINLAQFIKAQLIEAGIKKKNIELMNSCTSCNNNYYSHYRSLKTSKDQGRFATLIGMSR
jgi:YfiH family protein